MDDTTHVLIVSPDPVLRELLGQLLRTEHFVASEAASMAEVRHLCAMSHTAPNAILIDAIEGAELAKELLEDPWRILGDVQPPLLILAGSTTDTEVINHAFIDRVLQMPISSESLLEDVRYHCAVRPRRAMSSGVQIRVPAADGAGHGFEDDAFEDTLVEAG